MGVTISNFHPIFPIVTIRSKMGITARTSMTAKEQEVGFWSIGIHKKLLLRLTDLYKSNERWEATTLLY